MPRCHGGRPAALLHNYARAADADWRCVETLHTHTHARTHTHTHAHTHTRTHTRTHVTHAHTHARTHARTHAHTHTHLFCPVVKLPLHGYVSPIRGNKPQSSISRVPCSCMDCQTSSAQKPSATDCTLGGSTLLTHLLLPLMHFYYLSHFLSLSRLKFLEHTSQVTSHVPTDI